MGIPWTQAKVVNTPDNPLPVSPLGAESFYAIRSGILTPGGAETTLIQVLYPSVIEVLEIAGSLANAPRVRIQARQPNGSYVNMGFLNASGSGFLSLVPSQINRDGCAIFDMVSYDPAASKFKFVLNRPLALPNGFMVTVSNQASVDTNVGAAIYGRRIQ